MDAQQQQQPEPFEITAEMLATLHWPEIAKKHIDWAVEAEMISGGGRCGKQTQPEDYPRWDPDGLNVIGIRMNPITDYYKHNEVMYNDFLVYVYGENFNADGKFILVLPGTTDPADTDVNPKGDAHLGEGAYNAYVRGYHKGQKSRRALLQTKAQVFVVRTRSNGEITVREWGYFGINIHDMYGRRPSAGCQGYPRDGEGKVGNGANHKMVESFVDAAPSRDSRTYLLMNHEQLRSYIGA